MRREMLNHFLPYAAGSSLAGLSPEGSIDLPDRGEDGGTTATSRGPSAQAGDPALMGGHTGPNAQGAEFARDAQGRAKEGREAQQRQLAAQTGDTLYPASGDATVKVTATNSLSKCLHMVWSQATFHSAACISSSALQR